MDWISHYQLFLFDFDGLLVNTEALHLEAYKKMCAEKGYELDLDLATYQRIAQFDSNGQKSEICKRFPKLGEIEWEKLRNRKNEIYIEMIQEGNVTLMEGANELLTALKEKNTPHCVVTHSKKEQINPIINRHSILKSIPHWITREDYEKPKPHPDGYLKALSRWAGKGDKVIGFEDTPKGLKALLQAGVKAVLITPFFEKKELESLIEAEFDHFATLKEIRYI